MSEYARKKKPDPARSEKSGARPARAPQAQRAPGSGPAGPIYAAGPAFGLVQRKVEIGPADDAYEREADATADKVMEGKKAPPASAISADSGSKEKAKQEEKEAAKAKAEAKEKEAKQAKQEAKATEEEKQVQRKSAAPEEEKKPETGGGAKKAAGGKGAEAKGGEAKGTEAKGKEAKEPPKEAKDAKEPKDAKGAESKEKQTESEKKPAKPEEDKKQPVQTMPLEDEAEPATDEAPETEGVVQAKGEGGAGPGRGASAEAAAAEAINNKGPGKPLEPGVQKQLEPAFNADLSHVRVHDDANAHEAAKAMNARAFTHGNDIWLGKGQSPKDTRLMAHEVTHVFQQGNVVRRDQQTQGGGGGSGGGGATAVDDPGTPSGDNITFNQLPMPGWKVAAHSGSITRPKGYERPEDEADQKVVWERDVNKAQSVTKLQDKVNRAFRGRPPATTNNYVFAGPGNKIYGPGTLQSVAQRLTRPSWKGDGTAMNFDVDHKKELQLGGSNTVDNMELVKASANRSAGSQIKNGIEGRIKNYLKSQNQPQSKDKITEVKTGFNLTFGQAVDSGKGVQAGDAEKWTQTQIERGDHLERVTVRQGLGGNGKVIIFKDAGGGEGIEFNATGGVTAAERQVFEPFDLTAKQLNPGDDSGTATGPLGTLTIAIPANDPQWEPVPARQIMVTRMADSPFAGYLDQTGVTQAVATLRKKGLSPVTIRSVGFGASGLEVQGQILPTVPLLGGNGIDFQITGRDLAFSKEFTADEIALPRPFHLDSSSLLVSAGTNGVNLEGQVDFSIDKVGRGSLTAAAGTRTGFSLAGMFNFDSNLFERAEVRLRYQNEELSGEGDLVIGDGKVKGIKRGSLHVAFNSEGFTVSGSVEPKIPGVQQATVTTSYSEQEGFLIAGTLELADVPGIRSGTINVQLRKNDEGYDFAASGTAQPAVPGVNSQITIEYAKGLFKGELTADYRRGMLSGSIQVGVTNQPVDAATGQPAGGEGGDDLRMYGGGSVTIQIAPWLQGTIGIKLLENGEIEVSGEVGLPSTLDVFPQKAINKTLLSVNFDIPIVGVAVAGQRIGIFATIGGSLTANASIGPGQLQDVALRVLYNPDHEDQTQVTGTAKFHVPANAGLRLAVHGGIGAGIPIVSATAGLEVGGELGLEGAVDTSVEVNWNPTQGLSIDALGEFYVQPKFKFDVSAYVDVSADLWIDTIELYHRRWNLASFEYGSNLRFGIKFPIHYQEGQPFDISLSDVEFVVPEIDPMSTLRGLIDQIA